MTDYLSMLVQQSNTFPRDFFMSNATAECLDRRDLQWKRPDAL
jgi:hypothetical protein